MAYTDFEKAFDSVSHDKLLCKLRSYNIIGDLFSWLQSFLSNRSQCVRIDDCTSDFITVTSGVPQGSVLGPTLFLLYINDLVDCFDDLDCVCKLYADDAKLYSSYNMSNHSIDLSLALQRLTQWAEIWQLRLSFKKCTSHKITTVRCKNNNNTADFSYTIGSHSNLLPWSHLVRDLGITIDDHLDFKKHISNIVHAGKSRASLILKCFASRDPRILVKAYTTFVRPLLEFGTCIWSPHTNLLVDHVERVQRWYTKRIKGLFALSYSERLKRLQLDSLCVRRLKSDLIMCYKILNNLVDLDCSDFFVLANSNRTRGHSCKLFTQQCSLDVRKYCFANRVVEPWNHLPDHIVRASSVSLFRKLIDTVDLSGYCRY